MFVGQSIFSSWTRSPIGLLEHEIIDLLGTVQGPLVHTEVKFTPVQGASTWLNSHEILTLSISPKAVEI